jgi:uncharacterized protein YbjT (DUF2867 family)
VGSGRILVTGASGKLGQAVVEELVAHDYDVVGADRRLSPVRCRRLSAQITPSALLAGEHVDSRRHIGSNGIRPYWREDLTRMNALATTRDSLAM